MNKIFFSLVLSMFFPALVCMADITAINNAPQSHSLPNTLKNQDLQPVQDLGVIKINPKFANLKRTIELGAIERDSLNKKDAIDLNTTGNKYAGFLSAVSPDYKINKNFLKLTKVPDIRRRQSIMFVFFMNKNKIDPTLKDNSHTRMHVMWPGSKKLPLEQKAIDDEYPVDVSIANYEDGYASEGCNLVLPNKKPREVAVSLLWSF